MPREEWKCKRQKQPIQVARQGHEHEPGPSKEMPKTSTQPIKMAKQENLTLFDWMTVYTYVDTLPQLINQGEVVKYFATRPQGTLLFTQSTLSRKLQQHPETPHNHSKTSLPSNASNPCSRLGHCCPIRNKFVVDS